MAVVEAQNLYSPSSNSKTVTRLAVVAKGSEQHYPALSPSKVGIKVAVVAQGVRLLLRESSISIRKITKLFGQLFP